MTLDPGHRAARCVRAGFVGAGSHSFRNVYPALRYAPVDLVAVCDAAPDRAAVYARHFGAERTYVDHRSMLDGEDLDCVFVVTGYDAEGRVLHGPIAADCLRAGVATWVEKPPLATLEEIDVIRQAMADGGATTYAVGLKKAFAPANTKARSIIDDSSFGAVTSISLRYAQWVPGPTASQAERLFFLDHIGHPLSVLRLLGGPARTLVYERAHNGDAVALFTMASGAVASLHLPGSFAMHSIKERTEVSGEGGTVWVENNIRVTYAPRPSKADIVPYGRTPDFTYDNAAVRVWEPEFALGQLYNKGLFLLGYAPEIAHFADAVLAGRDVEIGGIDWAEEGIRIHDAFWKGPSRIIRLSP